MSCLLFQVSTSFPFLNEEKEWREYSKKEIFTAENEVDAVDSAIRWSKRTLEHTVKDWDGHPDSFIGCIKVYPKVVGEIDKDGVNTNRFGLSFFEWKYDWPGTLENYVEKFKGK